MATKDISTIIGYSGLSAGQHTLGVKATDSTGTYSDSTMTTTTFSKLLSPTNDSISGMDYSFDAIGGGVAPAEFDIYADNTLLGTVKGSSHTVGITVKGSSQNAYFIIKIYDGTNNMGRFLYNQRIDGTNTATTSVICTTGNLFVSVTSVDTFGFTSINCTGAISVKSSPAYYQRILSVGSNGTATITAWGDY